MPSDRILVGQFGAAHGVKGEVRLKSYTEEPLAIANYGPLATKTGRLIRFTSLRVQKDMLIVRVEGVDDRTGAEQLVNLQLFAEREALGTPQDEDEFFHADLLGLAARTEDGRLVGTVSGLFDFGAGDIVEVTPADGKPLLLPFTKAVAVEIDFDAGRIVIVPPNEIEGESQDGER